MVNKKLLNIESLTGLPTVAAEIILFSGTARILLFYGEMGAGKTTLIKSICECLGAAEPATSPTFSIVNEYASRESKIFHFDFYRLKDQSEAMDLGYEEYFYSGDWCFIEWPEKIPGLLPDHYIRVELKVLADSSREIIVEKI